MQRIPGQHWCFSFRGQDPAAGTWWRAKREPVFEAPLSREDPRTVSVTQEGPSGSLRLLDAAKIVHGNQEVLFIVNLEGRIERV